MTTAPADDRLSSSTAEDEQERIGSSGAKQDAERATGRSSDLLADQGSASPEAEQEAACAKTGDAAEERPDGDEDAGPTVEIGGPADFGGGATD